MKHTRRQLLGSLIAGGALASGVMRPASAGTSVQLPGWGDAPPGSRRAGSLGLNIAEAPASVASGQVPVAITIPQAEVDAEVERTKIVDGQMLDPSGPWIVAWYEGTGLAGSADNSVMSGHVDYWDVGPAVFRYVVNLPQGAEITVHGGEGGAFTYAVEYVERVEVASLTQEKLQQIVGPTGYGALTLITCGGEFDYDRGEYYSRDIIRARLLNTTPASTADSAPAQEEAPPADEPASGSLAEGASATIVDASVNLRSEPSTSGEVVSVLAPDTVVTITGAAQDADGYTWWPVATGDGSEGWLVEDYLAPAG